MCVFLDLVFLRQFTRQRCVNSFRGINEVEGAKPLEIINSEPNRAAKGRLLAGIK